MGDTARGRSQLRGLLRLAKALACCQPGTETRDSPLMYRPRETSCGMSGQRSGRLVNRRRQDYIANFAAVLLALTVTFGLILLLRSFCDPRVRSFAPHNVPFSPSNEVPDYRRLALVPWSQLASGLGSNVLELPRASLDFVGNWGGYTHDTGSSDVESPDHVSVVFGRRGDIVFFASELYTPSDQGILDKTTATIIDRREVSVTYKGEDENLDYIYLHRFKLLKSGKMAYNETVECYDRRTHKFVGTTGQGATLHRLTTALEKRAFAQPSSRDVFERELSTSNMIQTR
jgi:hypothetical protein